MGHGLTQQLPPPELEVEPDLKLVELALGFQFLLGPLLGTGQRPAPPGGGRRCSGPDR
jgi:hypothetical protein